MTPWPTTPGSVFFGDVASDATLSRATKDGRIRRLVRGLYSADLRAEPAELIARNRWRIVARFVPDAVIAEDCPTGACPAGVMPKTFGEQLSAAQLETLVQFLSELE